MESRRGGEAERMREVERKREMERGSDGGMERRREREADRRRECCALTSGRWGRVPPCKRRWW